MKDFVKKYGYNVFSQNGEDGILNECQKRILFSTLGIEIGAPTKTFCSNIFNLQVCKKIYYDINPQEEGIIKQEITTENINECGFWVGKWKDNEGEKSKVVTPDVLSIDIDGNDFNVWKAYEGKPAIVVIEINSSLDPDVEFFHPDKGASFCTMNRLANDKGYFLLCHTGNCIYVLNEYARLFPEIHLIVTSEHFFDRKWMAKESGKQFSLSNNNGYSYK